MKSNLNEVAALSASLYRHQQLGRLGSRSNFWADQEFESAARQSMWHVHILTNKPPSTFLRQESREQDESIVSVHNLCECCDCAVADNLYMVHVLCACVPVGDKLSCTDGWT